MLTIEEITNAIQKIAPKHDIKSVYLFGSYATGEADEISDCDFRIVGGNFKSLWDLGGLYADLEDELGKRVDVVETDHISNSFYEAIKNDEVLLYDTV